MTTTTLERYIPLTQAVKRLKISAASLRGLINSGNIKAVKINGTVAMAESDLGQVISREKFEHPLGGVRGKRLFDENGQPYQPKHTEWVVYQRERRKKKT